MKRNIFLVSILSVAMTALLSSCQIDNYAAPDATITGSVIDNATGKPIVTEPYGFRVEMDEISWSDNPVPRYISGYVDGTFTDKSYFAGTYVATAIDGAFDVPESQTIKVQSKGTATVTFNVNPYIRFNNVSIVKEGSTVKATFTLIKYVGSATPVDYAVIANAKTPYFGMSDNQVSSGNIPLTDADFGVPKVVVLTGFEAGKTYYVRIAAYCENPTGRYNYTEVVTIQM